MGKASGLDVRAIVAITKWKAPMDCCVANIPGANMFGYGAFDSNLVMRSITIMKSCHWSQICATTSLK